MTWIGPSGATWRTRITVGTVKLIRELAGVDLLQVLDGNLQADDDPVTLSAVLWPICRLQGEFFGVSRVEFEKEVRGDAIEHACVSLMSGLMDFFRRSRRNVREMKSPSATRANYMQKHGRLFTRWPGLPRLIPIH